jgi:hypothetical protein
LKELAADARDTKLEIEDLTNRVTALKKKEQTLLQEEIPALMDECHVDKVGLPASGNAPAYDLNLVPFYSANIAAGWDEARRKEGFEYLESLGEGDLIKTVISVPFARENRSDAVAVASELQQRGLVTVVAENVHTQTLTAWLKRQVEDKGFMPDLIKIGAQVGRTVKMKERKP